MMPIPACEAVVTDRVSNALNTQMSRELLGLWTLLTEDPGDTRRGVLVARTSYRASLASAAPKKASGRHARPNGRCQSFQ
jgi:hypothetical protein